MNKLNQEEQVFTLGGKVERLAAYLIDSLIAFISIIPLVSQFDASLFYDTSINSSTAFSIDSLIENTNNSTLGIFLILIILQFIIQGYLITTRGQSIGKIVMSLRIVNSIDGTNPGFIKAFLVRFILTQIITSIPYIGFIYIFADPLFIFRSDRRCIHDLMANTIVVESKKHPVLNKEK